MTIVGRPSVAAARRRQILEAAIRCIAAHGMSGATLDRIADEAGMARGHVRHFAGNRDDILVGAAVLLYFDAVPDLGADIMPGALPGAFFPHDVDTVDGALGYLFGEFAEPGATNTAALAFVDAGRTNADLHVVVTGAYASAESELAALVGRAYPDADADARSRTAKGIMSIAIGNVFLVDLQVGPQVGLQASPDLDRERTRLARESAGILLDALGAEVSARVSNGARPTRQTTGRK